MSESRIQSLDILKGIGILLVILCHTFMKEIGPYILTFHMPLFFIAGGFFFSYRPLSIQIRKDARRLLVPYAFVVIVIALLASIKTYKSSHIFSFDFSTLYECGTPAWFLLALFGSKLLFNIVYRYSAKYYLLVSFFLSSIPCFIAYFQEVTTFLSIGSSFCGVFFYALGFYIKEKNLLVRIAKYNSYLFILAILLWLNTSINGAVDVHFCIFKLWIIDFAGACSGVYLCFILSRLIEEKTGALKLILMKVGYFSFVIYSFHTIEYVFPDWHQIASFLDGTVIRPSFIFVLRLVFAYFAVLLTLRIPPLRSLFFVKSSFVDK